LHLGEEVAAERLKAALADQARMNEACAAAKGTARELTIRMRLQASNLQVAVCNRMVNGVTTPASRETAS
jgi:hypothetical protein